MQRYNIFKQVHKALRAMLYDVALSLQQNDFGNPEETERVMATMEKVWNCFNRHSRQEEKFILLVLRQWDATLGEVFVKERMMDQSISHRLVNLIPVYHKAVSGAAKIELGEAIIHAFNDYVAARLQQMNWEEENVNRILWIHYPDEVILSMHRMLLACSRVDCREYETKWMIRGISNGEIIRWLKEIEQSAPEVVWQELLALAETELPGRRWELIKESLTEGARIDC